MLVRACPPAPQGHTHTVALLLMILLMMTCDCTAECVVRDRHTAMPNVSGRDRRAVIMGWATSKTATGGPVFSDSTQAELASAGRLTPTLRQLTGC